MNHQAFRRDIGYSADQYRRQKERAISWLVALAFIWLGIIAVALPVPAFIVAVISDFPFGSVLAVLLVLTCVMGGRSK
jgi:uncharacterized membrane protein YdjX (TVP38/TMEM64 family)